MQNLNIVILAAGKGTRMHSTLPKVLHKLAGKTLLQHVLDAAKSLSPNRVVVVYGYGGSQVPDNFKNEEIIWVEQKEQLGTGHAVKQALPHVDETGKTLILLGDVPLIDVKECQMLINNTEKIGLLTVKKMNPFGYGRIVRENQTIQAIVEQKDANESESLINEVNTGIFVVENQSLKKWIQQLKNHNAQKEYYLTDIVSMAVKENITVSAVAVQTESSVEGVNSKADLAALERVYQRSQAEQLMQQGVTLYDPARIDIRGQLHVREGVEIDVGCIFEGEVEIGNQARVGAYCVIKNSTIAAGSVIAPFSHIEDATIGPNNRIGPYARLRPGTVLAEDAHIGNFVELKNAQVGVGSKINHLSYVGDASVGAHVNIGAGTITCNYDGTNKFRTVIEDYAFIGSDTQLVAPVTIGKYATIAAGSTITKDAPADTLTLCRAREQKSVAGWKRPQKMKKDH